jgi:hypothetical protein
LLAVYTLSPSGLTVIVSAFRTAWFVGGDGGGRYWTNDKPPAIAGGANAVDARSAATAAALAKIVDGRVMVGVSF